MALPRVGCDRDGERVGAHCRDARTAEQSDGLLPGRSEVMTTKMTQRPPAPSRAEYTSDRAKPCQFCGAAPTLQRWHGGGPEKTMIACDSEDCYAGPAVAQED